jgi:TonB-linked SusC/RagA family outer membrane protein
LSLALFAALALGAERADAQGTLTGRVTSSGGGEPVPEARVLVVGTSLYAIANSDGRYTIRNAPAGTAEVRALRVGFVEQKRPVTIRNGETTTLDFSMTPAVVKLQEVITTATGEQQRRIELGNSVASIDVSKLAESAPITSLNSVLTARTPGVQVASGLQTGAGMSIKIRGAGSLNLSNEPIYVIDGIRMTATTGDDAFFLSTGGARPSRTGDINPEEIENIEIVKGPSAATLYGTDAANGVVVITTKRGRAGAARWTVFGEAGRITDHNTYPTAYTADGHAANNVNSKLRGATCTLRDIASTAAGRCVVDSVRAYNIFTDPDATVLGVGHRYHTGAQVSGGTEALRYFFSGDRESETNLFTLPQFEQARFAASNLAVQPEWLNPNSLGKNSFRANVNATITPTLDVSVTSGYIDLQSRFMRESNLTAGIGSHIFGGPGFADNGNSAAGNPLHGYRQATPGEIFQEVRGQTVNRFIGSANANWRPRPWMSNRINVGMDLAHDTDIGYNYRGQGTAITTTNRLGFKDDARTTLRNISADIGSTGSFNLRDNVASKTTLGVQYVNFLRDLGENFGRDLPQGTTTTTNAASPGVNEASTLSRTLGAYVEEQVAFNDRLFVTGALRSDQNSAFGTNFQRVVYPKASVSWIVSEESFFPRVELLNQLRLRASFGSSGVQPGSNDALRSFEGRVVNVNGVDNPGVVYLSIGNAELRPERSSEFEGGFDTRFFNNRANLEFTYYNKRTKDALVDAIVPPSYGAAINVKRNLGAVRNTGIEVSLNTQLVDTRNVGFDVTFAGATNHNMLLDLGPDVPPVVSAPTRAQVGYPLFGYWDRPILSYEDKNGDGLITYSANAALSELTVGDSSVFIGNSQPTSNFTVAPGLDLFNKRIRISSLFEHKGGRYLFNNTERIRCTRPNCSGRENPSASLFEQARAVANIDHPSKTLAGFFEPADFTRWRELAVTLSLPESYAARFLRANSSSLTFAARNVHVWTKYRGVDPETDRLAADGGTNIGTVPDEFQTIGVPSYYTLRLNIVF